MVWGHCEHSPPPVPHWPTLAGSHVGPVQHPFGHDVASHEGQVPDVHTPGRQLPHIAPPEPHNVLSLPVSQIEPLQQPTHDVLSQRHTPPEQCWPSPQGSWLPHIHAPAAVHVSEVTPQSSHFDPATPQSPEDVVVTQLVPEQHPVHELELHTQAPPLQTCPAPQAPFVPQRQRPAVQLSDVAVLQATHWAASVPHVVGNDDVLQVLPEQHPTGQDVALQTHEPPEQSCPAAHCGFNPQRQAPEAEQLSALVVSHPVQASPSTPQVVKVEVSQVPPAQHPAGQFAGVQPVHMLPTQF